METNAIRKSASFRLKSDLLETLKKRAKDSNRSLNNYVESLLLDVVYHEPNEQTEKAIREASSNKPLETLDLDNFDDYAKSL